jgi:Amt family ammonium transporter
MRLTGKLLGLGGATATALAIGATPALAAVTDETQFVLNSFSFLIHGVLVMFMAAGFAMLESGLVRTKNTASICLKNIALYAVAGLLYYLIGYSLMYVDVADYIGSLDLFYNASDAELALINADEATDELIAPVVGGGYSVMSDWFFQMVFVATAASIVSGTVAERVKVWPFLIFTVILTGVIYPIQGSWTWGGGWLAQLGFSDFAGSTIVHSVGGWAALSGAIILGARKGRYGADGKVHAMPGANLPLATLGTFVLWFGWFGFNGGSQLALGSALDAAAIAIVYVNTNLAAAAVVGAVGGTLVVFTVPLLDKLRIDDVVGAISAHLVAGIWGTLAVGIFGGGSLAVQVIGIVAIGAFVLVTSSIVWLALKYSVGIRVSAENEDLGLDKAELGMEAYPEFGHGSQSI